MFFRQSILDVGLLYEKLSSLWVLLSRFPFYRLPPSNTQNNYEKLKATDENKTCSSLRNIFLPSFTYKYFLHFLFIGVLSPLLAWSLSSIFLPFSVSELGLCACKGLCIIRFWVVWESGSQRHHLQLILSFFNGC